MRVDGYDLAVVGVVLLGVSTVLFAHVGHLYTNEAAQMFMGTNPFQLRDSIISRWENRTAVLLLIVGGLVGILGTLRAASLGHEGYLVGPSRYAWETRRFPITMEIIVLIAVGLVLWRGTVGITNWLSAHEYVPVMVDQQRDLWQQSIFVLANGGRYRNEVEKGTTIEPAISQQRIERANGNLEQIGKLIDVPRKKNEPMKHYSDRLLPLFEVPGEKQVE